MLIRSRSGRLSAFSAMALSACLVAGSTVSAAASPAPGTAMTSQAKTPVSTAAHIPVVAPALPAGAGPAECVPRKGTAQRPPGPRADEGLLGYAELPPVADQAALPGKVHLRDGRSGFNRRFEFALHQGRLATRAVQGDGRWRQMRVPHCLDGKIVSFSVNDDELVAVDRAGWLYTLDNVLSSPRLWNWMRAWGAPFWSGSGHRTPTSAEGRWALSILGKHEDVSFTDRIGNPHAVAFAKVTQVLVLSPDGSRITYLDPWLPNDYSYEVGSPMGGRFRSESLSASGSTVFVTNRYGDMYTRLYDFDISGADRVFFRYSWQDQRGKPSIVNQLVEKLNLKYAAIQLPAPDWVRQPKVPGEITSRISIHSTAAGSHHRELRVEGRSGGRTGYWHKALTAPSWQFTPTGEALRGKMLENTPQDRSRDTLSPPQPYSYAGTARKAFSGDEFNFVLKNFDFAQTSRPVEVTYQGHRIPVILHSYDGMRLFPRGAGIDGKTRKLGAALELPAQLYADPESAGPGVASFVREMLKGKRIREVTVKVNENELRIPQLGLRMGRC
ncbi:hypothetical protein SAMN05421595_0169 [Austwickia chelonae]|uniref:Lipoprotein LpqB beta-propeller domain-containing protein n=1 Tax=Austwickia chelonae NBRC 105200 TaxID=1184607 RepID=K6VQD4_9MICO|nr:hypothetical protein [Austwickia chelonae]GAB78954.1 hypothetical protein AUCHE_17_01680 [Austwickia chelonae NBRC 105200]SEV87228.1 hypothetical protein SAMN05421595_0169 [Austwickia chelonae]